MKKMVCVSGTVFLLLSGCSSQKPTQLSTMTCNWPQEKTLLTGTGDLSMTFEYDKAKDLIKKQKQVLKFTLPDKESYDVAIQSLKDTDEVMGYSKIDGVKYAIEEDEEQLSIQESFDIDLENISGDDYYIISNGDIETKGSDTVLLSAIDTKTAMEKKGFACTVNE